jgi:hypothetical protein
MAATPPSVAIGHMREGSRAKRDQQPIPVFTTCPRYGRHAIRRRVGLGRQVEQADGNAGDWSAELGRVSGPPFLRDAKAVGLPSPWAHQPPRRGRSLRQPSNSARWSAWFNVPEAGSISLNLPPSSQ